MTDVVLCHERARANAEELGVEARDDGVGVEGRVEGLARDDVALEVLVQRPAVALREVSFHADLSEVGQIVTDVEPVRPRLRPSPIRVCKCNALSRLAKA